MSAELWRRSATDLAKAIREKEVSSREVTSIFRGEMPYQNLANHKEKC